MKDFAGGLAPLGPPQTFVQASQGLRGRDDFARLHHQIPAEDSARLDLRNAGWKVGAVSDRDGELRDLTFDLLLSEENGPPAESK